MQKISNLEKFIERAYSGTPYVRKLDTLSRSEKVLHDKNKMFRLIKSLNDISENEALVKKFEMILPKWVTNKPGQHSTNAIDYFIDDLSRLAHI